MSKNKTKLIEVSWILIISVFTISRGKKPNNMYNRKCHYNKEKKTNNKYTSWFQLKTIVMNECMYVCVICVYMYVCMYVFMCICVYVCMELSLSSLIFLYVHMINPNNNLNTNYECVCVLQRPTVCYRDLHGNRGGGLDVVAR